MKVITIGSDRKLFEKESNVYGRTLEYAEKMKELHIIVFSLKKHALKETSNKNLYIYPTNSLSRFSYIYDAIKISKKLIIKEGMNGASTVINCQDPFESGLVGYLLKRKFHLPLLLQVHTDFLSPYFKNNILNRIRVIMARFLIPKADSLRVVSSVIFDSIKIQFPNIKTDIQILPVFVDVDRIKNIVSNKERITQKAFKFSRNIFMASRLSPEKRFDTALESYKKVSDKITDVGLIISGVGSEEEKIRSLIKKLNLENKIQLMGWETGNDMSLFSARLSDVFLLTSEFEGYGMTLIEAGVIGLPIVTTDVGIARTPLFKNGENCFVCPVGDVDCLSDKLVDLIMNDEKRRLFKERMEDSIKKIVVTREEYVSKYIGLLENLLKK